MAILRFKGKTIDVTISRRGELSRLRFDGAEHEARLDPAGNGSHRLTLDGEDHRVWLATQGDHTFVHAFGRHWELERVDAPDAACPDTTGVGDTSHAPMPGVIIGVAVEQGQVVEEGQSLLTMESMKLQTTVAAWRDGTVETIHVSASDSVDKGSALISLVAEERRS
jgi:3-methylcrotonyl-CoA carboxylase alpha subunit